MKRVLQCAHCAYATEASLIPVEGNLLELDPNNRDYIDVQEWDYELHLWTQHRVRRLNQLDVPKRHLVEV